MAYAISVLLLLGIALKFSASGKSLRRSWRNRRKEQRAIGRALGFWVPDRFGNTFLVRKSEAFVESTLLREGVWEAEIAEILAAFLKPGDQVAVFGTHVGVHALNMARLIGTNGHLWGFEANPETQKFFRINLLLNNVENVTLIPNAVYDREQVLSFMMLQANSGGSQIQLSEADRSALQAYDSSARAINITTVRADDALCDVGAIDFLMMDIEGAEPRAILGAEKLIERSPNLLILQEWTPSAMSKHMSLEDYMAALRQRGFIHFFEIRKVSRHHNELTYVENPATLIALSGLTNVLIARNKERVVDTYSRYLKGIS